MVKAALTFKSQATDEESDKRTKSGRRCDDERNIGAWNVKRTEKDKFQNPDGNKWVRNK